MSNYVEFAKLFTDRVEKSMDFGTLNEQARAQVWASMALTGGILEIAHAIHRLAGAVEKMEEGQRSDRLSR